LLKYRELRARWRVCIDMGIPPELIPFEQIEDRIYLIRGHKVMLGRDLAELYSVPTKAFNQAVKRNRTRFPEDFMFRLTWAESKAWWSHIMAPRLRSQTVTLKRGQHIKFRPYAFTEHGILMLSSVLNSERADRVNIEIMRTFVRLRRLLISHQDLARRLDELEMNYDTQFRVVFKAIRNLMAPRGTSRRQIGFQP
jgi:hypothetical protein